MACVEIFQPKNGYCYNCDSLFLWDFSLPFVRQNARVLDIGAGSGILSLLLARDKNASGICVEIEPQMAALCAKNIAHNNANFEVANVNFLDFQSGEKFDIAISNPPFYNSAVRSKNRQKDLARNAKNLPLDIMLKTAKKCLKPNGNLLFCYDARLADSALNHLLNAGFKPTHLKFIHPTAQKPATLILICAKINSKSPLEILPPLFTHNTPPQSSTDYTAQTAQIFSTAKTKSIKV